ncbi:metallophosphoesterase [Abyssisolibacter fermentans]|uniref:metallophosphoesterase n=1 Tax=Abyssisolibacter fermentans TaxID=1766203 RepID=UPI000830A5A1|nr:metallophosphoesterase [Abyssisolibacter fermentans]
MEKIGVISDLHLGGLNSPKTSDTIISVLSEIDYSNCSKLVIVGDFLDRWALDIDTVPKSYEELQNKDTVCKEVISKLDDLSKKGIKIFFFNGNHDFDLMSKDLPDFITYLEPKESHKITPGVHFEHGNSVDLFNAIGESDDEKIKFPLGYFKTRLNHSFNRLPMQRDLQVNRVKQNVISSLEKMNSNEYLTLEEFDKHLDEFGILFLDALYEDVKCGFRYDNIDSIEIKMPEGHNPKYYNFSSDIYHNYRGFVKRFYYDHFLPNIEDSHKDLDNDNKLFYIEEFIHAIDPVRTGGFKWYAERLIKSHRIPNTSTFIFGHTHMCQLNNLCINGCNYVCSNSGCLCDNTIGPNTTILYYENGRTTLHNVDVHSKVVNCSNNGFKEQPVLAR